MRIALTRLCCLGLCCLLFFGIGGTAVTSAASAVDQKVDSAVESDPMGEMVNRTAVTDVPQNADASLSSGGQYWEKQEIYLRIGENATSGRYRMYKVNAAGETTNLVDTVQLTAGGNGGTIYLDDHDGRYVMLDPNNDPIRFEDGVSQGTSTIGRASFYVTPQTLSFTFEQTTLINTVETTATIDSNRGVYTVELSAGNLTDEQITSIFGGTTFRIEDTRELTANFSGIKLDKYTINATVTDTGVETGATVTVGDLEDQRLGPKVSFDRRVVSAYRGNIAEFKIAIEGTDQVTLRIGGRDFGYLARVNATDTNEDDRITIRMNTYLAGWMNSSDGKATGVFSVADGDTLNNATRVTDQLNELLAVGSYPTKISSGGSQQIGRFELNEEQFSGMTQLIAPSRIGVDEADTFDNASAVSAAATKRSTIAIGDLLIFRIDATGMNTFLKTPEQLTRSPETPPGTSVEITPINAPPNRNDIAIHPDDGAATLYPANDTGRFYLVIDTDATNATPGLEYRATFTLGTGNKRIETDDNAITTTTTFTVEERMLDFHRRNDQDVLVKPRENQLIFGTTNLAPGSELTLVARSEGKWSFRHEQTTTVTDSGGFFAQFDFSEQIAIVPFTIAARKDGRTLKQTRGLIVKQFPSETPQDVTPTTESSPTPDRTRTIVKTPNGTRATPTPAVKTIVKTKTAIVTRTVQQTPTTQSPGQPGFGPLSSSVVILIALVVWRRWD